jgi:hypothetical protein
MREQSDTAAGAAARPAWCRAVTTGRCGLAGYACDGEPERCLMARIAR